MSLPVFTWVLDHSEERLGNRLTLLALAEHAHDDGSKAFPSNATLMKRTRLSERAVRDSLRSLETNGAIMCTGTTPSGTRVYRVVGPFNVPAESAPAESAGGAKSVSKDAPEPSGTRHGSSSTTGWLPRSVGGQPVTDQEREWTDSLLADFNSLTGKRFAGKDWRTMIVRRMREHPEMGLADHVALVKHMTAHPWWKGDPTPSVIWGNGKTFDLGLNRVTSDADGHNDLGYTREDD